ncbi:MAG TPA: hypothetical protein VMB79_18825 [Jatrophihabitans sp.]|nr:hypothetical protein [Jatrophihabitans sp.]
MVARRYLFSGAALALVLAGCGSTHHSAASVPGTPAVTTPVLLPGSSTAGTPLPGTPTPSQVSVPPYLCDATDQAQNAADAYMGALSAGNEKQAVACVYPGTVPVAVTRGLLATTKGTAVYLPRDGADGPTVFGYQGNGKSIDVTVTKRSGGRFWVTKVAVR